MEKLNRNWFRLAQIRRCRSQRKIAFWRARNIARERLRRRVLELDDQIN